MTTVNAATQAQIDAANPDASTWLSANAGSGKTRVLTDRVARLLLNGVPPQRILCLTYTKAAASEMQNRLFKRLGTWSMLDDAHLKASLEELGIEDLEDKNRARTLFARAIETPGGLKIQTIHSFCASLLRQFPLEAGVSPQFRELDDLGQMKLIDEVVESLAVSSPEVLESLGAHYSGQSFSDLAMDIAGSVEKFGAEPSEILKAFELDSLPDDEDLLEIALRPGDLNFLQKLPDTLNQSEKVTDTKLAMQLSELQAADASGKLAILSLSLLTGPTANTPYSAKVGSLPTANMRNGPFAPFLADFQRVMSQVETAHERRQSRDAAMKTLALHAFSNTFLPAYAKAKSDRGVLDFNDLISVARNLLHDVDMAWILFRLDGGIDHILVDEAQDTSPAQWSVIRKLSEEMTAGQGARDVSRTLFVVGDKKQSIYSFQGADAQGFDEMRDTLLAVPGDTPGLDQRALVYSFRSAPAVLQVVDKVFDGPNAAGLGDAVLHRAFHERLPGRVDLWDLEAVSDTEQDPPWHLPVDRTSAHSPRVRLADRVAANIEEMLKTGTIQGENGKHRRIEPEDILILVRSRGEVFDAVIRACKALELPIAGADQLRVNAELAVRDILALLSFVSLQEDSLSLAAALRSPLFGWSEEDLYRLAYPRGQDVSLWRALRERADEFPDVVEKLLELRRRADVLRPYELIELILTRMNGRRDLISRLGVEAEDGIDALLARALSYEQSEVPTLTGFLAQTQAEDVTIKRRSDSSSGLIRVMTVHGAKGLEAPIVILPDTVHQQPKAKGVFVATKGSIPVWNVSASEAPPHIRAQMEAANQAAAEEDNRLLYVAMTRAANWLIVAGAETKNMPKSFWWQSVEAAMQSLAATRLELGTRSIQRFETGVWPREEPPRTPEQEETRQSAAFTDAPVASHADKVRVFSPSNLGGAKVLVGESETSDADGAKHRGIVVHRLLEVLPDLPQREWSAASVRLAGEDADVVLEEVSLTIGSAPDLFGPNSRSEVTLTATAKDVGAMIIGAIDRLVVTEGSVRIADFKTNAEVPPTPESVPEGLLRQMGAYLVAAEQIWPEHEITLEIVWTRTASRMALPHAIVREAFKRTPIS